LIYTEGEISEPMVVDFKAIFNVRWQPDNVLEESDFIKAGLEGGDLEFF